MFTDGVGSCTVDLDYCEVTAEHVSDGETFVFSIGGRGMRVFASHESILTVDIGWLEFTLPIYSGLSEDLRRFDKETIIHISNKVKLYKLPNSYWIKGDHVDIDFICDDKLFEFLAELIDEVIDMEFIEHYDGKVISSNVEFQYLANRYLN
jgi:hypothetical protein